jgi:indole-3-glycerol phosphate synthase
MANVLTPEELARFHGQALDLGMEALFEVHTEEEIHTLPASARIVGINSRKFRSTTGFVQEGASSDQDFSLDFSAFDLADRLPPQAIKVAESGLTPSNLPQMANRFSAALVGTALLRDPRGPAACLADFEAASLHP